MHAEEDVDRAKAWLADQEETHWERLRYLADICRRTSQPFWAAYLDGRIIAFNRTCCELLGYTEDPLRAMDWTVDLTPLEWRETEARALEYMHLTKQPQLYEKEYIRRDGSRVAVEMFVHPVCDFEGNIQYYYAFITDITECKGMRREINESRRRLKHLIAVSSPLIYSCKPTGDYQCTFISQKVKTLFGYEPAEFLADPRFWISHIHSEGSPSVLTVLSCLAEHKYHALEYRFQHKDGTYLWIRNVLGLVRDSYGNPQEIIGRWIAVTEEKQLEKAHREGAHGFRQTG